MTTKRVFSDFRNPSQGLSSTEEFIQRCKTICSGDNPPQRKRDGLDQSTIMTFISLLSDIAIRCQSLETHVREVQTQVTDLQKAVQDLCITGDLKTAPSGPVPKLSSPEDSSPDMSENGDTETAATTVIPTTGTSSKQKKSETDDLKERLQILKRSTFDLRRQNELLRRMLEIQCTINANAAKTAAEKEKDKNKAHAGDGTHTVQQADSTSNNNSTSKGTHATSVLLSPNAQDYVPSGASSTTGAKPPSDQDLQLKNQEDEEYVPLSAEEMLAQTFADPKVPWSTNDGTGKSELKEDLECQEPNISRYAYVSGPCVKPQMMQPASPTGNVVAGSMSMTPKGSHVMYGRQTLGDTFHWERKTFEKQSNLGTTVQHEWAQK